MHASPSRFGESNPPPKCRHRGHAFDDTVDNVACLSSRPECVPMTSTGEGSDDAKVGPPSTAAIDYPVHEMLFAEDADAVLRRHLAMGIEAAAARPKSGKE